MKIIPVSEVEINSIIISLKSKNSKGYDRLSNKTLKHFINYLSKLLTYICNCSLTTGIFPERCKFANVWFIYKKWKNNAIGNYTPVPLLIALPKIPEIIVF
jgi:hypothetical protein